MLALEVRLLTGRYVATAFDDRGRAEWPPHPARLFSALCATHFESESPATGEREALRWLEEQGDPDISAPEVAHRDVVTVYVPVNDTNVVPPLDDELADVEALRAQLAQTTAAKARPPLEKKLLKAEQKFAEASRKAIARVPDGKENNDAIRRAENVLPASRLRQPRTFPSVAPLDLEIVDPVVVFSWSAADPSPDLRHRLDTLAGRIARLGHSSSLVSVRVRSDAPTGNWLPDTSAVATGDGIIIRSVERGQTEAVEASFQLRGDDPGRVLPAAFRRYRRPDTVVAPASSSVFGDDWIVLARDSRIRGGRREPRLPAFRGPQVAATVRRALMAAHGPGAPELLSGHPAHGGPSERPHLAYVPLPDVGHAHAHGGILGVALVLPRNATRDERRLVHRALGKWAEAANERRHQDDGNIDVLPVHLGLSGVLHLVVQHDPTLEGLRASTWCGATARRPAGARRWVSATPVALDRNPGELRSRDPAAQAAAYAEAESTIAIACERIGLPKPRTVVALPAAPLAAAEKARFFPPFKSGGVQRVLVHASLIFSEPVRGPILLGAGRYFGLGVFRPVGDDD